MSLSLARLCPLMHIQGQVPYKCIFQEVRMAIKFNPHYTVYQTVLKALGVRAEMYSMLCSTCHERTELYFVMFKSTAIY